MGRRNMKAWGCRAVVYSDTTGDLKDVASHIDTQPTNMLSLYERGPSKQQGHSDRAYLYLV